MTTNGGPNSASAATASPSLVQVRARAVGMPAAAMTCLANDFDPSSIAARRPGPKQAMPAARERVGQPGHQRRLRADHHQAGADRAGQRGHRRDVGQVHRVGGRDRGDAGVARRRVQVADVRVGRERTCQRVLTAAGPQQKDSHGASLPGAGRVAPLLRALTRVVLPDSLGTPALAGARRAGRAVRRARPQMSGRSCRVWSRRGPVPTAATGAPMISSTART